MRLAFVLTKKPVSIDAHAIAKAFVQLFPSEARPVVAAGNDPMAGTLHIDGDDVILGAMPAAVPGGEAEGATRFSVGSFGNAPPLEAHGGHIVVVQRDQRSATESLTRFTRALAAVMTATDAVGVYWGEAGVTHTAPFFLDVASTDAGSVMLWSGISIAQMDGRLELLSLGMKQAQLPDLLISVPRGQANAALGVFFDLLGYAVSRNAPPADQETVGRTAAEKWTVRHVPSPIDPERKVWRVDLPNDFR